MKHNKKLLLLASTVIATSVLAAPIAEASTYVVGKGDTLTKIAKTNSTTVEKIKEWNQLNNDLIFVGQKLALSATKVEQSPKPAKPQTKPIKVVSVTTQQSATESKISQYQVEKGDTLTKIANKFSINVAELKKLNNLASDKIFVGQTLRIDKNVQEVGEPVKEFSSDVVKETDQQIDKQLLKEKPVLAAPSVVGQASYAKVISLASELMGIPYQYGGNTPEGFDCSGFVRYVFSNAGVDIARKSSKDYFLNDTTLVETPVAGDVVFFKDTYIAGISHMGIYLGDGAFIHAGTNGVELSKLEYEYWDTRFVAFKRFNQFITK
ncbi:C40 family peptidase [Lysinibacillus antri]|uniref:LysM peptidoglycan-binding domain-containing protein n=1 Tax=Lysinibacillus antri TaxID=2498145 RepID=A0A432LD51_9BACI|nr:LysM peptidoglycan-binding domain-containing protein [Lysinibacillus antri]RUL54164.1 LysM peptidoglycan-binding domain-containing protein [Lysinibacillus antri]